MKRNSILKWISLAALLALCLMALMPIAAPAALADGTGWSVSSSTSGTSTTFTVTRTDTAAAATVLYRTVSLSAIAGQHFTAASGTLTFAAGEDTKSVTVSEKTPTADAYRYQTASSRSYRFEVQGRDGAILAYKDRDVTSGLTQFSAAKVSKSVTNLVTLTSGGSFSSGMSSGKYLDVSFSTSGMTETSDTLSGYVLIDDSYDYAQKPAPVSTSTLISSTGAPASYLNSLGYKIYATVCFTEKEKDDGYQYLQIVAGNSAASYDTGADKNGEVYDPVNSVYKVCYELSDNSDQGQGKAYFPHRGTGTGEFSLSDGKLWEQKYKGDDYNGSGAVILPVTTNYITTRFDAAGKDNDTWGYKDFFVRMALRDATAPTKLSDPVVSPGPYGYGQTVYVSVPFSEMVTVSGTPYLHTDWGDFDYVSGSGSNVLTFSGAIDADFGENLVVRSLSGTVTDLAGNAFTGGSNVYKSFSCTVGLPWGGSGNEGDPYVITTAAQLDYLAARVNDDYGGDNFNGKYFELGTDIAYSTEAVWNAEAAVSDNNFTPIGGWGHSFQGHFDGKGHVISGIRYCVDSNSDYKGQSIGLFGFVSDGTVKDVVLCDANFEGERDLGGIVGYLSGGSVTGCLLHNVRAATYKDSATSYNVDTVVGNNQGGTVSGCHFRDCAIGTYNRTSTASETAFVWTNTRVDDLFTVTAGEGVTLTGGESFVLDGTTYYAAGSEITLGYTGSVAEGEFVHYAAVSSSGDIPIYDNSGSLLEVMPGDITGYAVTVEGGVSTLTVGSVKISIHEYSTVQFGDVTVTAQVLPVLTYTGADGQAQTCGDYTPITGSVGQVTLGAQNKTRWYAVSESASISASLRFLDAEANVIICDGKTLSVNADSYSAAIFCNGLSLYGQSQGTGRLTSAAMSSALQCYGDLTINGVSVSAVKSMSGSDCKAISATEHTVTLGLYSRLSSFTATDVYCDTFTIRSGQTLTDGEGHAYSGNLTADEIAAIAGKTLHLPIWDEENGATGSAEHPYLIRTPADLDLLSQQVNGQGGYDYNDFSGKCFELANDIDYTTDWNNAGSDENNFTAIGGWRDGSNYNYFKGTFDGKGYTVRGIRIYKAGSGDEYSCQGLFGCIGAGGVVKDLTLADAHITGNVNVGGIAGVNYGAVSDCTVEGNVLVAASSSGGDYHGGVVGNNSRGTVSGCTVSATVSATSSTSTWYGAVAGYNGYNATISNCLAWGASVPALNQYYGVITGENGSNGTSSTGILTANHYLDCAVGSTANAMNVGAGRKSSSPADRDGARSVHTLTLGDNITVSGGESVEIDGATFCAAGVDITLGYTGEVPEGQVVLYSIAHNESEETLTGDTFTMPVEAISVSARVVTQWAWLQAQLAAGNSVTLDRDYADTAGEGPLTVPSGKTVVLDLNGHIVDRALETRTGDGCVVKVEGSLTLRDSAPTAAHSGTDVAGGILTGGNAGNGGGVVVTGSGASFTMEGGAITGNNASSGGGVYVTGGASFAMEGGAITGNTAGDGGGVFVVGDGAGFTMTGGSITGNTASYGGGGVFVVGDGAGFTMTGGSITGNTASYGGGGVKADNHAAVAMEGGAVTDNTAGYGGGLYLYQGTTVNLCGAVTVTGNTEGGVASNLYLNGDRHMINVTGDLAGASVGVTLWDLEINGPRAFTTGLSGNGTAANFTSDDSAYGVYLDGDGEAALGVRYAVHIAEGIAGGTVNAHPASALPGETITLSISPDTGYMSTGETVTDASGASVPLEYGLLFAMPESDVTVSATFTMDWNSLSDALRYNGGLITLRGDVAAGEGNESLNVPSDRNAILDLNGHTLTGPNGQAVILINGGSLTLRDSDGGGMITHAQGATGCGVYIYGNTNTSAFTMEGGTITGNTATGNYGGGVYVYNTKASFTMNGGAICGNAARDGGGVKIYGGSFAMSGAASITGNTATGDGGGVCVTGSNASFTMEGGSITGNAARENGGGIYSGIMKDLKLSGSVTVTGNLGGVQADGTGGRTENVYLENANANIQPTAALDEDARIGVTLNGGGRAFTTGLSGKGTLDNFTSDDSAYGLYLNDSGEAALKALYNVVIPGDIQHGSVSASPAIACEGATVTLTATPDRLCVLDALGVYYYDSEGVPQYIPLTQGTGENADKYTFTMPAEHVTVSATFSQTPVAYLENHSPRTCNEYTVLEGSDAAVTLSDGWYVADGTASYSDISFTGNAFLILTDGCELTVGGSIDADLSLVVYGQQRQTGRLTVTSTGFGMHAHNCVDIYGGTVDVTVTGDSTAISGDGGVNINGGRIRAVSPDGTGIISSDGYIQLSWTQGDDSIYASNYRGMVQLALDFIDEGEGTVYWSNFYEGGDISDKTLVPLYSRAVNIADNITHGTVTADVQRAFEGDTVTLALAPDTGYAIGAVGYDDGSDAYEITPVNGIYSFTMPNRDVTVTAEFRPVFSIAVADAEHGTVAADTDSAFAGDPITLTITPDAGCALDALAVTYEDAQGTRTVSTTQGTGANADKYTFTMPAFDVTVTASFAPVYPVIIESAIQHGAVSANPSSACAGKTVTLTVAPASGYALESLAVTYEDADHEPLTAPTTQGTGENANQYSFTMPGEDVTVTATFITEWAWLNRQLAAGGTVTLTKDYTAAAEDGPLTVPEGVTVTLDLNGHTLDRGLADASAIADGYVIQVKSGGSLTLNDSSAGKTGKVTGGRNRNAGGGVYVAGTFVMNGGEISGNESTGNSGGGVFVSDSGPGAFAMNGGAVTGNEAYYSGGGVCVYPGASMSVSGAARIEGNAYGDNLCLNGQIQVTVTGALTGEIGVWQSNSQPGDVFAGADADYNGGRLTASDAAAFASDDTGYAVGLDADGRAYFGTPITTATVVLQGVRYDGSGHDYDLVALTVNGTELTAGTDYAVVYRQNGEAATPVNAGEYQYEITGMGSYAGTTTGNVTLLPAPVKLTANSGNETYDGNEKTLEGFACDAYSAATGGYDTTVDGLTFAGVTASGSGTNAGAYAVTFSGVTVNTTKDTTGNYVVTGTTNGLLTINPAAVTLTANSGSFTYDGTEKTLEGFTCSVYNADTGEYDTPVSGLTFAGVTASFSETNAFEYDVTFSGVTLGETKDTTGNYVVTQTVDGTLTINPAPVTLTANSGVLTYDGLSRGVTGFTASVDGVAVDGLTFEGVTAHSRFYIDVGTYAVTFSGVTLNETTDTTRNYVVTQTIDGTLTINPASGLAVSLNGSGYTYDGTPKAIANAPTTNAKGSATRYTYSFEEAGTYVADLGSLTRTDAGSYTVYVKATNPNYSNTATATATLAIGPKSVSVPAAATGLKWTGAAQTGVAAGEGYTVTGGAAADAGNHTATAALVSANYVWSDGTTANVTIPWAIARADGPEAPAGLAGVAPTSEDGGDGRITGVTAAMEYAARADFSDARACAGTEITGLAAGDYHVRVKATATHEAGASATVTVPAYVPPTYAVTVVAGAGGTAGASPAIARAGATVALTVTPDTGYALDTLTVTDGYGNAVTVTDNTFTMPDSDVTVNAAFVRQTFTVAFVNEDGTVLQSGPVAYGDTPAYTGQTPVKASTAQYSYTFAGWRPAISQVSGNATYTAKYDAEARRYSLTLTPVAHAAVTAVDSNDEPITGPVAWDDTVEVRIQADPGYRLTGLSYTPDGGEAVALDPYVDSTYSFHAWFDMPAADTTVTASVAPIPALSLGENSVAFTQDNTHYLFTPAETGYYSFRTTGEHSFGPFLDIYDAEENEIGSAWPMEETDNFSGVFQLQGGSTYSVYFFCWEGSGTCPVHIERVEEHAILVAPDTRHGSVRIEDYSSSEEISAAPGGTMVELVIVSDAGYAFASLRVTDASGAETAAVIEQRGEAILAYFPMPNSEATVSAVFVEENVHIDADWYSFAFLYVNDEGTFQYYAEAGDSVRLALRSRTGHALDWSSVTVTLDSDGSAVPFTPDSDAGTVAFTMPNGAVTVGFSSVALGLPTMTPGENRITGDDGRLYSFTPTESGVYRCYVSYIRITNQRGEDLTGSQGRDPDGPYGPYYWPAWLLAGNTYYFDFTHSNLSDPVYLIKESEAAAWTITVDADTPHGRIHVFEKSAVENSFVELFCKPDAGYRLGAWIVTGADGTPIEVEYSSAEYLTSNDLFHMPAQNVTVSATFVPKQAELPEFGTPDFTLPAALTAIEESAFEGMTMMTVVDAGNCASIGKWAFKDCTNLRQIRLPADCAIDATAFDGCGTVYVFAPAGGTTQVYCTGNAGCVFVAEGE